MHKVFKPNYLQIYKKYIYLVFFSFEAEIRLFLITFLTLNHQAISCQRTIVYYDVYNFYDKKVVKKVLEHICAIRFRQNIY